MEGFFKSIGIFFSRFVLELIGFYVRKFFFKIFGEKKASKIKKRNYYEVIDIESLRTELLA